VAQARCGGQATWAVELLFFRTSGHLPHAPCNPSGCTCAVIVFGWCPPSIEEVAKIKSPNPFQSENNEMSRDVKGLFLGVRFVSSQAG
jgi:hypothetical protein